MKLPVSLHVALAVAGLSWLSSPVSAQPAPAPADPIPTFEIYGTLVPFLEATRTTGATEPGAATGVTQVSAATYSGANIQGRGVLDPSTSNLGFRGGIDLMTDLAVVWQIESGIPIDGSAAGTVAGRNTYVGLAGKSWGTLFVGNWDTPYKWGSNPIVNPVRAGILPDYNNIMHNPGFGVSSVTGGATRGGNPNDAAFYRRAGNSIQYWTPTFSGLSARFVYQFNEGRTVRTGATLLAPSIQPQILGATVAYDQGPIKLRYSFEAHLDYFGMAGNAAAPGLGGSQPSVTNRSSFDMGHEVVAQYTNVAKDFDTRIVGMFEFLSYSSDDSTVNMAMTPVAKAYSRPAFYALVDQTLMGKHHLYGAFGMAFPGSCEIVGGATCSTDGLGANIATLGYVYRFSKNTDIWLSAYRITNNESASYTQSPGIGGVPTAPGADIEAIGIGYLHQFSAKIGGPAKPAPAPPPPPPVAVEPAPEPPPGTPPAPGTPATPPPNPNP
jgi:predicted porin